MKKVFIGFCLIAINVFAFSSLFSAPSAPAEEWHWITIKSCICGTGVLHPDGKCDFGDCEDLPIFWACTDDIPCGPCLT